MFHTHKIYTNNYILIKKHRAKILSLIVNREYNPALTVFVRYQKDEKIE